MINAIWQYGTDNGRALFNFRLVAVAAVFPEFIAREQPSQRGAGCQGGSAGLVRPAAQRGHGPARLDGQAPLATVAGSVMKERGRRMTGLRPDERRTNAARQAPLRATGNHDSKKIL